MINGGLGLQLSADSTGGMIAYGVIAGIVGVTWIGVVLLDLVKSRGKEEGETGEKIIGAGANGSSPIESEEMQRAE